MEILKTHLDNFLCNLPGATCFNRDVGLNNLQRSLPTSEILQFDSWTSQLHQESVPDGLILEKNLCSEHLPASQYSIFRSQPEVTQFCMLQSLCTRAEFLLRLSFTSSPTLSLLHWWGILWFKLKVCCAPDPVWPLRRYLTFWCPPSVKLAEIKSAKKQMLHLCGLFHSSVCLIST